MIDPAKAAEWHHNADDLTTSTARLLEQLIQARRERDQAQAEALKLQRRLEHQQSRCERLQAQLALLAAWRRTVKRRKRERQNQQSLDLGISDKGT